MAGRARSDGLKVEGDGLAEGFSWAPLSMEQYVRKMRERFTLRNTWTRSVLADADKKRKNRSGGAWQQETVQRRAGARQAQQ